MAIFFIAEREGSDIFVRMLSIRSAVVAIAALLVVCQPALRAQEEKPALVVENLGLKNTYRVIFSQFDEENKFVTGAIEILGDDDGRQVPHTRATFSGEIKTDAKDKKTELLEVSSTMDLAFFAPADKKQPYPTVIWKLTGRKAGKPLLKAKFWMFNSEKESWQLEEMEFEKAQQ